MVMSAAGRRRVSRCERVFWCVIQNCMARPDSDVGAVISPDCFRFGAHDYHAIS